MTEHENDTDRNPVNTRDGGGVTERHVRERAARVSPTRHEDAARCADEQRGHDA